MTVSGEPTNAESSAPYPSREREGLRSQGQAWKRVERLVAFAFAALLVWMVWRHTDANQLLDAFAGIEWHYYAAAVASLFAYQSLRTLRTRTLVDAPLSFFKLFDTVCILSLINSYFLAGLGDIGIVYLLNRRHGITIHLGAATFVMAGIADLTVFVALFLVLMVAMAGVIPAGVYLVIAGVAGALIVGIAAILLFGRIANWETLTTLSRRTGAIGWTARFAHSFAEALRALRSPRILLPVLWQSTLMWVFHYLQWLFILRAIGLPLSPIEVLWIYLLAFAASFLPVRGLAAMGPRIAVWFFSLQLMGVDEAQAATAALAADIMLQTLALWVGAVPLVTPLLRGLQARRR